MIAKTLSAGLMGIEAYVVHVEIDIQNKQLPSWHTVGLAESAVKESKDRVVAAIRNSGYDFLFRKVTINLAPADTKKVGTAFDLPISIALLAASDLVPKERLWDTLLVGELSLDGELRPVKGILPMAVLAKQMAISQMVVPYENMQEASVVSGVDVYGAKHLSQVVEFLTGRLALQPAKSPDFEAPCAAGVCAEDFRDVYGQYQAKRAVEVAASGGHNILLSGPPGSGKSLIASRLPSILPELSFEQSLEASKIYSVMGLLKGQCQLLRQPPFRSPHHSVSNAGLIGGGSVPRPGEVSLAHNGVLFLDELPEFQKNVLELLRQPLETHEVTIARAATSLTFPARFVMVASCNPCICGFLSHPVKQCTCTPQQIQRYRTKLSGPLLDRIDIQIEVPPVPYDEFRNKKKKGETSAVIAKRVKNVRDVQAERYKDTHITLNSQMTTSLIEKYCELDEAGEKILKSSMEKFQLSARGMSRILKVSRTIADMDGSESITMDHILEAVQYRGIDWSGRNITY